jgi:hypothetical protein
MNKIIINQTQDFEYLNFLYHRGLSSDVDLTEVYKTNRVDSFRVESMLHYTNGVPLDYINHTLLAQKREHQVVLFQKIVDELLSNTEVETLSERKNKVQNALNDKSKSYEQYLYENIRSTGKDLIYVGDPRLFFLTPLLDMVDFSYVKQPFFFDTANFRDITIYILRKCELDHAEMNNTFIAFDDFIGDLILPPEPWKYSVDKDVDSYIITTKLQHEYTLNRSIKAFKII